MHDIAVSGADLAGKRQTKPALLQMNIADFQAPFLRDLASMPLPGTPGTGPGPLSSVRSVVPDPSTPLTLYQPVAHVIHVALVQLECETVGYPRLDPKRVLSAGLVIRRVPRVQGSLQTALGWEPDTTWPWMTNANGQFSWLKHGQAGGSTSVAPLWKPDDDPDPAKRPQLQSGSAELDQLLAAQSLAHAMTEVSSLAFVAPPSVCDAVQRTLVYAVIPTASSQTANMQTTSVAPLDSDSLLAILPPFLKGQTQTVPQADMYVTYKLMSDEYARAQGKSDFLPFSAALRMLYSTFGAFDDSATAKPLIDLLNTHTVTIWNGSGYVQQPMGNFYREAAATLIAYNPNTQNQGDPVPELRMPSSWNFPTAAEQSTMISVMATVLQTRGNSSAVPEGRFQDATRYYRARMFFRIQGETPSCPPELVWSRYSDPFRIAAWFESAGHVAPPVPLPDLLSGNALQNLKPSTSFAVPASLLNAVQNASLTGLTSGTPSASGGGVKLTWICAFNLPIVTVCAFFVLNIFLTLLNIVFYWMPFVKIAIPFPVPAPSTSED